MTATFWNGEPCEARQVTLLVGDSPHSLAWSNPFIGQRRAAVEVVYNNECFYLDDEAGHGWAKVTEGRGSPRWGHRSVYPVAGSVDLRGSA